MATLGELEAKYFATGADAGQVYSESSTVEPLLDGYEYFNAVRAAIDATGAGDVVYLLGWWVEHACPTHLPRTDIEAMELKALLATKADDGVDVRVAIWANPHLLDHSTLASWFGVDGFLNVVSRNVASAVAMRSYPGAGATPPLSDRVLLDHSGEYVGSHHQKAVFVKAGDQVSAFVGGIDFQDSRWDQPPHRAHTKTITSAGGSTTSIAWGWHDAGVKLTGPAVDGVLENFRSRWNEAISLPDASYELDGATALYNPAKLQAPVANVPPPPPTSPPHQSVQVLRSLGKVKTSTFWGASTPWADVALADGLRQVRKTLLKAIGAATRYVYVEDQAYDSPAVLFPALVAACERGVKVIAVAPGVADPHDGAGNPTLPREIPERVQEGVVAAIVGSNRSNFAFYQVDATTVHSKIVLIDDEFLCIGSANFRDRSLQETPDGCDSELSIAAVDAGTLVRDVRRRLWCDHLNVDPNDATVREQLEPLGSGLGLWRPAWATSGAPTFPRPNSKLALVGPP